MPPVFGPLSPSPTRLWSWLVAIGSTFWPSTMTMKLASLAIEELLDHHARAGVAEGIAGEHVAHGGFGFVQVHGDDHALARGQAIGLDDDGRALLVQVGQGRLDLGEVAIGGGGDPVAGEEVLGEGLRAFQLGGAGGRAEDIQAALAEQVDHACHQRRLGTDDGQLDVLRGEVGQLLQGQHVDGDVLALGFGGGAGVARATKTFATRGSWATFQARACSRPPLPMMSTFMGFSWRNGG